MTPVQLAIRCAATADADEVARVHVACWRETYAGLIPARVLDLLDVDARASMWRDTIRNDVFATFVVEGEDGRIVGFASCGQRRDVPEIFDGEILAIYLLREVQGRGFGRALFRRMGAALTEGGYRSAGLRVARDAETARRFYERMGGVDAGEDSHRTEDFNVVTTVYGWTDITVLIKES